MKKLLIATFLILFSSSAFSETYTCDKSSTVLKRIGDIFIRKSDLSEYKILDETDNRLAIYEIIDDYDNFIISIISISKVNLTYISYLLDSYEDKEYEEVDKPYFGKCEVSD